MKKPDINWSDPKARITGTHFTVGEVIAKSGYLKMPRGPIRVGPLFAITPRKNAVLHARKLEELRIQINLSRRNRGLPEAGIQINSWARSWTHNKDVSGARFSKHLFFLATDITREEIQRLMPWSNGERQFDALANRIFVKGGFGTYPGGARHVDSRGYRARWSDWIPGR